MSTRYDPARILRLAAELDLAPRQLLVLAGMLASSPDRPLDGELLARRVREVRDAGAATDAAASLLLLGYGAYAEDELDRALAWLWTGRQVGMDRACVAQR